MAGPTNSLTRRTLAIAGGALCGAILPWNSRASANIVGAVRSVTIGVDNLDRALALFKDTMGMSIEARTQLSAARRSAWQLPDGVTGELVELSCAGYPVGRVRLLRLTPTPTTFVRDDAGPQATDSPIAYGPKAVDTYAQGVFEDAVEKFTRAGLEPRHDAPAVYPGGLRESIFTGLGRTPTMVMERPSTPSSDMRADLPTDRFSEIATMSVISRDLDATRRFYGEILGFESRSDRIMPDSFAEPVRTLTGGPAGVPIHWVIFAEPGQGSAKFLVLDFAQSPKVPLRNGMHPRHLGIGVYSFPVSDIGTLAGRLHAAGFEIIAPPQSVDGAPTMIVRGPNGEFCEFVET